MFIALLADWFGFGQPGSFGIGQFLLVLVGLLTGLIGLLGKRIVNLYQGVAIILLNTLVLLACLELGAIIISRSGLMPSYQETIWVGYQELPYYATQDWAPVYWREAKLAENYGYKPYVIWRHLPFEGETININQEGLRQTPGANCSADAYKVFVFGGSTMWGWGSPDWETIAAHLQQGLEDLIEGPVCVINFGEDSFVSTQSLIELIRQLQFGNVPDAAIFYDGVNTVYAGHESGRSGVHPGFEKIAAKFEEDEHPLLKWIKASRQYTLIESLVNKLKAVRQDNSLKLLNDEAMEIKTHFLADSLTQVYLTNYKVVRTLSQEFGFEVFFFWQPHLGIDKKPLTIEEQALKSTMDPKLIALTKAVYERIYVSTLEYEHLWYIADVFEGHEEQIWIDAWGHVTPEGNRLVAQKMLSMIKKSRSALKR